MNKEPFLQVSKRRNPVDMNMLFKVMAQILKK